VNLDAARIVLRPRSISELFDLGLRVMSGPAAKLFSKLGALTLVPALGLCVAARYALAWPWVWVWMLALALVTPLQGLFTIAISRLMFADEVTVGEVLRQYLRRLPAYLGALLVTRVLIALMSTAFFLIVPPFWMWGRSAYVHEACLLEQAGPIDAVRRAGRMVSGQVTGTIGLLLLTSLATLAFVLIGESLLNDGLLKFVLQLGRPLGALFEAGGSVPALIGLMFAVPYWATVRFLAYIDTRTRRDGWDVQLRFMAIASRAAQAADHGLDRHRTSQPASHPATHAERSRA
jgi:hypothetical protein